MSCEGNCSCKEQPIIHSPSQNTSDDIWDEEEDPKPLQDINRAHYKQGYLDGLVYQQEDSLQQGFDQGFPEGAKLGIQVGKILAVLKLKNEQLFEQAKLELNIVKVLDKKYFDDKLNVISEIPTISKWLDIISEY
ncbi:Uncharacterized protein YAE1 [Spathaspora sp. JA1]|nr:Uncharacterized protein YAE1 [Spathaspora sp. JA1]